MGKIEKAPHIYYKMNENNLKIEKRGFLFIDLRDSMTQVERLGLLPYSRFIKHCFGILETNRTQYPFIELHQYAGDGVILTWKALAQAPKAIQFAQDFLQALEEERSRFEGFFQCFPYFSIAINIGEVVESKIGPHRVFYGNAINSTARLQGLCQHYERQILISEQIFDACPDLKFEYLNRVYLKGLPTAMNIYSVY